MTIFNADERKEAISFINTLSTVMHNVAVDKGFWEEPKETGTYIALMHSELSEALEADRKNKMDDHLPQRQGIEVELADAVIRIFDFAGAKRLDLGGAIVDKIEYNSTRPYKHGKEY